MTSELHIGRCASKEAEPQRGVDTRRCASRTLGPEGGGLGGPTLIGEGNEDARPQKETSL